MMNPQHGSRRAGGSQVLLVEGSSDHARPGRRAAINYLTAEQLLTVLTHAGNVAESVEHLLLRQRDPAHAALWVRAAMRGGHYPHRRYVRRWAILLLSGGLP